MNIFDETSNDNKNLDKNTAVTKIIRIPNNNIVAKPLTELSPKKNNTAAAITVVKLESKLLGTNFVRFRKGLLYRSTYSKFILNTLIHDNIGIYSHTYT